MWFWGIFLAINYESIVFFFYPNLFLITNRYFNLSLHDARREFKWLLCSRKIGIKCRYQRYLIYIKKNSVSYNLKNLLLKEQFVFILVLHSDTNYFNHCTAFVKLFNSFFQEKYLSTFIFVVSRSKNFPLEPVCNLHI